MRRFPAPFVPFLAVGAALCAQALLAQDAARSRPWPYSMDYGPYLMTTFEGGGRTGDTMKGVVVGLGDAGAVAFDTELLRLSAAWTDGWLHLRGTAYDGAHGPMVRMRGQKVAETNNAPGWANAGSFADPRAIPHGPLPRSWGQYQGLRLVGDQVVVEYRVGDMAVREGYGIDRQPRIVLRTLELGPSTQEQRMVVADGPQDSDSPPPQSRLGLLIWNEEPADRVEYAQTTAAWSTLPMGGPSSKDYLDASSGKGATIAFVPGLARAHGRKAPAEGVADAPEALRLPVLHDGAGSANDDDWNGSTWFDKHKVNGRDSDAGRWLVDLKDVVDVWRISTYSWHQGYRSVQQYEVFGSNANAAPDALARDPERAGWQKIASVDTGELGQGDKHAASIGNGSTLGRFRHLLFAVRSGGAFFSEVDVFAGDRQAPVDVDGRPVRMLACALRGEHPATLEVQGGRILLRVPPHEQPLRLQLAMTAGDEAHLEAVLPALTRNDPVAALPTAPRAAQWGEPIVTQGSLGTGDGPFAVDTITIPFENRFGSRMRTGAFDFFRDGRAAVSTWNGDVWIVSGIDADLDRLEWRRFATGLFDPLGVRIVDDVLYVHGRDGITRLHDTDGNGEADWYECFNNMVQITHAFHEFAFDLQTDPDGNFYLSKGAPVNPGGRGFMKIVPHHGTILKVAKDGSSIEAIATGLRAPNGIGVSASGVFTSGDNEGTFMPRCRLNWFTAPGFYAGVKDTAHRSPAPEQPDLPLCWMPMEVDNSSGGQVWVTGAGWRDLDGRLLHLSYGTCSTYLVLPETVDGQIQGGVVRLPANFSSSCMRGRFGPDGQLYVVGLQGWQTSAAREGGFHRVRRTAAPLSVPTALRTCDKGVYLTFTEALDPETAEAPDSYGVEVWNYLYSPNYGSPELSVLQPDRKVEQGKPNRDALRVSAAKLSPDGRTVFLAIDGMRPVHQMKVGWNVDTKAGATWQGELHNSIHKLAADPGFPTER